MQIPDLSVELPVAAPGRSSAPSAGGDTFVEALDALLGEVDEATMAIAAAGALTAGLAPVVILPPAGTPIPTTDATAERALASLTVPGLPVAAATDTGTIAVLAETDAAADAVVTPAEIELAPSPAATDATHETLAPESSEAAAPGATEPVVADGAEPPAADPTPGQGAVAAPRNDRSHSDASRDPGGDRRDDQRGTERAVERAPAYAAVHPSPTPPPGQVDKAAPAAAEPQPADGVLEPAPVTLDRAVGAADPTPAAVTHGPGASEGPVAPSQLDRAIVEAVRQLREGRKETGHIVLQLDPPELGAVNVRFVVRGEEIQVTMHSANGDARAALADQRASIQDAFTSAGLELRDFDITGGESQRREPDRGHRPPTLAVDPTLIDATVGDGALRL